MKRIIYFCILIFVQLHSDWETSRVMVGTTVMREDSKVPDVQNFKGFVLDFKAWQSKVLNNTLLFMIPFTFTYLKENSKEIGHYIVMQ